MSFPLWEKKRPCKNINMNLASGRPHVFFAVIQVGGLIVKGRSGTECVCTLVSRRFLFAHARVGNNILLQANRGTSTDRHMCIGVLMHAL